MLSLYSFCPYDPLLSLYIVETTCKVSPEKSTCRVMRNRIRSGLWTNDRMTEARPTFSSFTGRAEENWTLGPREHCKRT
jgi:hypothetical protein